MGVVCAVALLPMARWFSQKAPDTEHSQGVLEDDWSELMASMDKMHHSIASTKPSGDSDVDFVKLMLPHHQAAIDMARTQLICGKSPEMRRLAQEIIIDQQSEIQLMQLWLKQRSKEN
jgi:uncharacterized protein (DUF305 family)